MDFTELTGLADREASQLSKGQAQRLCLGRTLLHDPEVLILDEPAAGLDPKARVEFKNLVRLLAERGKTIFISSHILSELAEMCGSLLFIDQGRIVHHGTAESLTDPQQQGTVLAVRVLGDPAHLVAWANLNPGVQLLSQNENGVRLAVDKTEPGDLADLLKRMIADGIPVVDFHREQRRLEESFIEMLKKLEGGHEK